MGSSLSSCATIVDVLRLRAEREPGRIGYTFLEDGESAAYTYAELDAQARTIAGFLRARYTAGERVVLLFQPGLEYIGALFGCMYAGLIAVPAYPPSMAKLLQTGTRLRTIAADCEPAVALGKRELLEPLAQALNGDPVLGRLGWHDTADLEPSWAGEWKALPLDAGRVAFLQYTSGSTSAPRGVMVTHGNLLHNEECIRKACEHSQASTFVGWLPFYHDMGLIGNILQPLYLGSQSILLSPSAFLQKPVRWLRAISDYQGATSGGPDFAYQLCARRVTAEERATLDLRSWTLAFNGAEPIRGETMELFAQTFAACGFRKDAFYPCYGLAEATLMVSASRRKTLPVERDFDTGGLRMGQALPAGAEAGAASSLVSSGQAVDGLEIAIVDPASGTSCSADTIGEIWVSSSSVALGYWNRPQETADTFSARRADQPESAYLRTGDLGFLNYGELFVTGRLKDLIILRGRNYYPQDLELAAEHCHPALRPGGGAAFGIDSAEGERLVVVHEVEREWVRRPLEEVAHAIRRAIAALHEIEPYAVILIRPGQLPKTSSGKVRRGACRDAFQSGQLEPLAHAVFEPADTGVEDASATDLESSIRRLIARLARTPQDRLGENDRIGDLGLDSLRVIELRHGLERILRVSLPGSLRLDNLRVRDLSSIAFTPEPGPGPARRPGGGACVLSDGQRGLWLLHQIAPENSAYNIGRAVRIRGPLSIESLRRSFETLYQRHAALRSAFHAGPGGPVRVDAASESWLEIDQDATLGPAEAASRLRAEAHYRFSPHQGPLFRVAVFKQAEEDHVLILNMHHLVADLWSVGILLREFLALYSGADARTLAALPIDYADYVHWHAELLASAEGQRQASYWARQLAGPPAPLALPYDRAPVLPPRFEGATHEFEIPSDLLQALRSLAASTRTTPFSCLLAVFALLLGRETGQDDFLVGVPCSGRSRADLAELVGYLANLTPVRIGVADELTVRDLIRRIHTRVQDAVAHQDYPFPLMVERIAGLRTGSGQLAINVLFAMQAFPQSELQPLAPLTMGLPGGRLQLGQVSLETLALRQTGSQFDLGLFAAEHGDRLLVSLEYNRDVFERSTVERLARSFRALAEQVVQGPDAPVVQALTLTPAERNQIEAWNTTAATYSEPETLLACIEETCARAPGQAAVSDEFGRLTYGELNERANRLARYLRQRGATPETVIAICLERSVELEIVLLAILKTGAAYLPLDPSEPPARLRGMLEDSRAVLLITGRKFVECLPALVPCLVIEEAIRLAEARQGGNLGVDSLPQQAAYVIYTSGSTGQPKGVVNTHAGIRNRLIWMQRAYGLGSGDRVLQKTPYTFDVSVWEFFWPLMAGAELVMARPEGHKDTHYLAGALRSRGITTVHFVPSQLRLLLNEPGLGELALRRVICSGEALDQDLQEQFFSRLPGVELHNLYGPTEASIDVTAWACRPGAPVSIGRPIANATAYILDHKLQPAPAGVAGELCLGGVGLARGYLNRPGLTAERFVPHPLGAAEGQRLYRTGDRACWTSEGTLKYLGRLDNQVKVRGARVELGEIEAALRRVTDARHVAADFHADELTAYLVGVPGDAAVGWRRSLREHLPDYMIPATFVMLNELPLTPSGKLDRRALRNARSSDAATQAPGAPPRTAVEEQLARIWAEVFRRERVGIHDHFFDLGGHSLLATQLVSRIRDAFRCDLPVALMFSSGVTVAGLAAEIEERLLQGAGANATAALVSEILAASDDEVRSRLAELNAV